MPKRKQTQLGRSTKDCNSDGSYHYQVVNGQHIYHEKQRLRLCGLHAINSLLQRPVFDENRLNLIGNSLFATESKLRCNEPFITNHYYNKFGDYSIDVLREALQLKDIILRRINDLSALADAQAFIIHSNDHWFSLRKFDGHWVNLNSTLDRPTVIEHIHIQSFLNSLTEPSVYVIDGDLPEIPEENVQTSKKQSTTSMSEKIEELTKQWKEAAKELKGTQKENAIKLVEAQKAEAQQLKAQQKQAAINFKKQQFQDAIKLKERHKKEAEELQQQQMDGMMSLFNLLQFKCS